MITVFTLAIGLPLLTWGIASFICLFITGFGYQGTPQAVQLGMQLGIGQFAKAAAGENNNIYCRNEVLLETKGFSCDAFNPIAVHCVTYVFLTNN